MTAELLVERDDVRVYHASWAELLEALPRREDGTVADALIVDAPYSERTHTGHDDGAGAANRADETWVRADGRREKSSAARRALSYPAWTEADVAAFVAAWTMRTSGWFVSITDHVLAPAWAREMERWGRYVFSPLACVRPGSRVRMLGDGPAQWSEFAIVSRPRDGGWLDRWRADRTRLGLPRALPGAYVVRDTEHAGSRVTGGKPLWLMERLVEDYSRPGDLIVDPCCGAGTTLLAALRTGRRAVGGDALREHAEIAADRCGRRMVQRPLLVEGT